MQALATLLVVLGTLGLSFLASPASASTESNRIGIVTTSVTLEPWDSDTFGGEIVFEVSGNTPANLEVDILDLWSDERGARVTVPLGSTPLSGEGRLRVLPHPIRYVPNGETQTIRIPVEIARSSLEQAPLAAGVKLTLTKTPDQTNEGGVNITGAGLAYVYAIPEDYSGDLSAYTPSVRVTQAVVTSPADIIEGRPLRPVNFVEGGIVAVAFETENSGNLFAFVTHVLDVRKLGWWVPPEERFSPVFTRDFRETVLVPGQLRLDWVGVTGTIVETGQSVNLVADWGIYEATVTTTHHTGFDEPTADQTSIIFFVFPIRTTLAFLIVAALFVAGGTHLAKRKRKNQTLGEPLNLAEV